MHFFNGGAPILHVTARENNVMDIFCTSITNAPWKTSHSNYIAGNNYYLACAEYSGKIKLPFSENWIILSRVEYNMTVSWSPPNWLWGYFIPVGLLLLTWGGLDKQQARRVTSLAGFSLAITALCYWAVGFAFHMGGAQAVLPDNPALEGLGVLYTLVPDQPGWGFIGLDGFFLAGNAIGPAVYGYFLTYLPLLATSVLFISFAMQKFRRSLVLMTAVLVAALVVPVALCWVWGSGWLAHLGETMGFGYGFVDFGGGSLVFWLPAMLLLGFLLVQPGRLSGRLSLQNPPVTHHPLVANIGALLLGIGWMGWILSNPFHIAGANIYWQRTALSLILGMAGAVLSSQLYAWLVMGAPEALLAARGLSAGWAALMVGAPFLSPWLAFVLGLLSGFVFPFIQSAAESFAKFQQAAATLAMGITAGPMGVFSVVLFADGSWGQGWNNIVRIAEAVSPDTTSSLSGVAGIFVTRDLAQLKAQVVGLAALGLWGLFWGVIIGIFARIFAPVETPGKANTVASTADSIAEPVQVDKFSELKPASGADTSEGLQPEGLSGEEDALQPPGLTVQENMAAGAVHDQA
jgi:Amt family ammonium transporter